MTRIVHNDHADPAKDTCRRPGCGHVRGKHKGPHTKCTGLNYDPFGPTAPCECPVFVEPIVRKPAAPAPPMVSLRLRWQGAPPAIGDYLMSSGRGTRFGYKIIELRRVDNLDAEPPTYEVDALKVPVKEMPTGVTIHPWKWDPRDRKNKTGTAWGKDA